MSWQKTVLNQYSASQKLLSVIATFEQAVSLEDFTDRFLDEVWDITTCNRFGLDMWGKIVNITSFAPIKKRSIFKFNSA